MIEQNQEDGYITSAQVRELLGVSYATFYAKKRSGDLPPPSLTIGKYSFWTRNQVEGLEIKRPRGGRRSRKDKAHDPA